MNINEFWQIIEPAKSDSEPEIKVSEAIRKLPPKEIIAYQEHFDQLFHDADRWDLWGAAYMISGGCSDDGFIDFRYGLIAKGRAVYEKTLKNPDSLAGLGLDVEIENEAFGYIAQEVFEELTGEEIPRTETAEKDTLGEQWDFDNDDENKKYIPMLTALYEIEINDKQLQIEKPEPDCYIFPAMCGNAETIRFKFGWNEKSTKFLVNNNVDSIELIGENFNIPNLGKHAEKITILSMSYLDLISGIEQFVNIKSLYLSELPKTFIKLSEFKKLTRLSIVWNKKYEDEINDCNKLLYFSISTYKYRDLSQLNCFSLLKSVSFSRGNIESMSGINPKLEGLGLSYTTKFSDIKSIQKLNNLIYLDINNAKKLNGILKVGQFKRLIYLNIVDALCILDLQGIERLKNLDTLWCNNDCVNVNWAKIMALPKIRAIGLYADGITDEDIYKMAKENNKNIESFTRAGTKKKPFLKIIFDVKHVRISSYFE